MTDESFIGPQTGIQISDTMVSNAYILSQVAKEMGWSYFDFMAALTLALYTVSELKEGAQLGVAEHYSDVDDSDLHASGGYN